MSKAFSFLDAVYRVRFSNPKTIKGLSKSQLKRRKLNLSRWPFTFQSSKSTTIKLNLCCKFGINLARHSDNKAQKNNLAPRVAES